MQKRRRNHLDAAHQGQSLRHLPNRLPQEGFARDAEQRNGTQIWLRAAALMLLVAVASLSTLAKNSLYYPHHSETRFVNIASKMNAAKPLMAFERAPLQPVRQLIPPIPDYSEPVRTEPPNLSIQPIALIVSPLRRPPPVVPA